VSGSSRRLTVRFALSSSPLVRRAPIWVTIGG
jgi:hypothetical protein